MKWMVLILAVAMATVLPVVSAYPESADSSGGNPSAELRFAVRIPERITVRAQENGGQVDVRVSSLASRGDVVAVNTENGTSRRASGGSAFSTVIRSDGSDSLYTIALP